MCYQWSFTAKLQPALLCVSEIDAGDILQMFGKMFFEFCQESGYDTILRVLGSNVREFLQVCSLLFACTVAALAGNCCILQGPH